MYCYAPDTIPSDPLILPDGQCAGPGPFMGLPPTAAAAAPVSSSKAPASSSRPQWSGVAPTGWWGSEGNILPARERNLKALKESSYFPDEYGL